MCLAKGAQLSDRLTNCRIRLENLSEVGLSSAGENGVTNQTTDVVCSLTPERRGLARVFLDRNLVRCREGCASAPT